MFEKLFARLDSNLIMQVAGEKGTIVAIGCDQSNFDEPNADMITCQTVTPTEKVLVAGKIW